MAKKKWFEPSGKSLGWSKGDGQAKRRTAALASRKGNHLRAAKALMALANVTTDRETERKSRADALYFYRQHKRHKKG